MRKRSHMENIRAALIVSLIKKRLNTRVPSVPKRVNGDLISIIKMCNYRFLLTDEARQHLLVMLTHRFFDRFTTFERTWRGSTCRDLRIYFRLRSRGLAFCPGCDGATRTSRILNEITLREVIAQKDSISKNISRANKMYSYWNNLGDDYLRPN